ncbi:hypothetical protein [Haloarcula argentinensis]|uniref:Uncharacterized protein n=1 Tax=Haloarcula argentinensis TaxID=43776 RepID=A0ABU2F632_HALAR|nr:hypothetical protein [Haloarcula argentinensis]EMA25220.1 hypothetical protein C443_03454 [Haloarcula argentinensis DSM 12282]MDS0255984.1 hypothetical protein [Haloarcula argentinensis]
MDEIDWSGPPLITLNEDPEELFDWTVETTKFGELFAQFMYEPQEASETVVYMFDSLGAAHPEDIRAAHRELAEANDH